MTAIAEKSPVCELIEGLSDRDLSRKVQALWILSSEEAGLTRLAGRVPAQAMAYRLFAGRLVHLCSSLHADLKLSGLREDHSIVALRDALLDQVEVTVLVGEDTHRGPYVPGGSYTEPTCEIVVESHRIELDLDELGGVDNLPRVIEAHYGGSRSGQDFDCDLVFELQSTAGATAVYFCQLA